MCKVIRFLNIRDLRLIKNLCIWKRINREYNRRLFLIAEEIARNKDCLIGPRISKELEWAEKISKLSDISKKNNERCHSLIVAFICIIPILLATTLRVNSTPVVFNVISDNLSIELNSDWSSDTPSSPKSFFLDYVVSANSGGLPPSNEALNLKTPNSPFRVSLKGNGIVVRKFIIFAGATVDFTYKSNTLKIYTKKSSMRATLDASKANLTLPKPGGYRSIPIFVKNSNPPETLNFETKEMREIPVLLEMGFGGKKKWLVKRAKTNTTSSLQEVPVVLELGFDEQKKWDFKGIQAKAINFSEEFPLGSGQFRSSIRAGEIKLEMSNETITLTEADVLTLNIKKSKKINISDAKNGIRIFFDGDVSQILAGMKGYEKNLKPTYLEHFFHQKRQLTIWAALTSLFGILWGVRNFIFRK